MNWRQHEEMTAKSVPPNQEGENMARQAKKYLHGRTSSILLVVALSVFSGASGADSPEWYVLSHEEGCVSLQEFVKFGELSRAPTSPEDFIQLMRAKGKPARIVPMPSVPPGHEDDFVMVKVSDSMMPVFARARVCSKIGPHAR
jgi:hypothetical protein